MIHDLQLRQKIIKVCFETRKFRLFDRLSVFEGGGSDLNKSKGGNKKQKSTTTDDTNQPGKISSAIFLFIVVV